MAEDAASTPEPQAEAKPTEPFSGLDLTEPHESKKDTTHGPRLVRVHSGHIVLTSPHPVASQVSAQGLMATHSEPTPSSAQVEQASPLKDSAERATGEPSSSIPIWLPNGPSNISYSTPTPPPPPPPRVPSGHMSGDSSYPSVEDDPEYSTRKSASPSGTQSPPVAEPFSLAIRGIPVIRVQQPTPDPSQMQLEEVASERPSQPEVAGIFFRAPLQRACTSLESTAAAPDIPATVTEQPGTGAAPLQIPPASPRPISVKPHKSRLMLRKCRNRLAAEPLLNLALGRSVAKITKPALRLAANPTEAAVALEAAGSGAHSEPALLRSAR